MSKLHLLTSEQPTSASLVELQQSSVGLSRTNYASKLSSGKFDNGVALFRIALTRLEQAMRCCWKYKFDPEEVEQASRSREIDKDIRREWKERKREMRKQVRLLLLGAGESGKSTFLKQMRIIHGVGFDQEDVREFQHIIYGNIIQGMRVLVDARDKLNIRWENENNEYHGQKLLQFQPTLCIDQWTFINYVPSIIACWSDGAIQKAFRLRNLFQISDSVQYFYNNIHRIAAKDWIPSITDIVHSRRATKGISELGITINRVPFCFIDVGGQRSQRVKWLQCFDAITSILFMVATSEFDQVLLEDRSTNRLKESTVIFDTIYHARQLSSVSVILFLNKIDLLVEKVSAGISISHYFPEFQKSDRSVDDVKEFILELFLKGREGHASSKMSRMPRLYHHFTTAVDTENIRVVFNTVKDTILNRNLENLMLS